MVTKFGRTAAITPFDYGGIFRGEVDGLRYRSGYPSLVHLLSQTWEIWPTREARVEHLVGKVQKASLRSSAVWGREWR